MNINKYKKFIVALGAALVVLGAALSDGVLTMTEMVQVGAAFLGALGVFQARNSK